MAENLREPIDVVKVVGGGQLAYMLGEAAMPLGIRLEVLEKNAAECPAVHAGAIPIEGAITDPDGIAQLAEGEGVMTIEIEHGDSLELIDWYDAGKIAHPNPYELHMIKDKFRQKRWLESHGIPVVPYTDDFNNPAFRGPVMMKAKRGGFDGRGNFRIESWDDPRIMTDFNSHDYYAEQIVDFSMELSAIVARDWDGNVVSYPVVQTVHEDSICHKVTSAEGLIDEDIERAAMARGREVANLFSGAGIYAIEMFVVDGQVMVNEIAPRVHNSGHLTIEANNTSQFKQHLLAVTGRPLESPDRKEDVKAAVMINILGREAAILDLVQVQATTTFPKGINGIFAHMYWKQPRPQRKLGHVTGLGSTIEEAEEKAVNGVEYVNRMIEKYKISAS